VLVDFTIHIVDGRKPMDVQVKIHDNLAALRSAATRHTNVWVDPPVNGDHSRVLGICHRFHLDNDPVVAIVRLAPPELGIGIISHELAHAAVWIREIETKFEKQPIDCSNDERFCWILGWLVHCTVEVMYQNGLEIRV